MVKLLIGGSPCTHWSIAQTKSRETTPEGIGWELFKNYLIAKEKFNPDFFLYENNKSAASAIKEQICTELNHDLMYIDSALVSAQQRKRFYVFNGEIKQPQDRGILLKDILESSEYIAEREKAYALSHIQGNMRDYITHHHTNIVFKPIRIGDIGTTAQGHRVYSSNGKAVSIKANAGSGGGKTGLYLVPMYHYPHGFNKGGIRYHKKSMTLVSNPGAIANHKVIEPPTPLFDGKPIYTVKDGYITYKDKQYPINLPDGDYIIRKLTVTECERLQTMPDGYTSALINGKPVSDTQRYKCLGNGWTAEVIIHILGELLKDVPKNEKIIVLSMYDGIATGRYCLDKMGFTNVEYHAYEIDKYAQAIALSNYPDIIQHGDAFGVRKDLNI